MDYIKRSAILTSVLILGTAISAVAATSQGDDCRRLAAYKADGGVDYDKLDATSAIAVCEKALVQAAGNLSLSAYYSRALRKAGRSADSLQAARTSAEGGNPIGETLLGNLYEFGDGIPKDEIEAARLYRKAAEQGYATGQLDLGIKLQNGLGIPKNLVEAAHWYRMSADQGDADAQDRLGIMYDNGLGVPETLTEAVRWYQMSAAQGLSIGQQHLGNSYEHGRGVKQDYAEAGRWYRRAAEQGRLSAQIKLARLYELGGYGLKEDDAEAIRLYRDAAEHGNVDAQMTLYDGCQWSERSFNLARIDQNGRRSEASSQPDGPPYVG